MGDPEHAEFAAPCRVKPQVARISDKACSAVRALNAIDWAVTTRRTTLSEAASAPAGAAGGGNFREY